MKIDLPENTIGFETSEDCSVFPLDDENFLDWKAYQLPMEWEQDWRFTENGMRFTIGSISMYRFYISKEIVFLIQYYN